MRASQEWLPPVLLLSLVYLHMISVRMRFKAAPSSWDRFSLCSSASRVRRVGGVADMKFALTVRWKIFTIQSLAFWVIGNIAPREHSHRTAREIISTVAAGKIRAKKEYEIYIERDLSFKRKLCVSCAAAAADNSGCDFVVFFYINSITSVIVRLFYKSGSFEADTINKDNIYNSKITTGKYVHISLTKGKHMCALARLSFSLYKYFSCVEESIFFFHTHSHPSRPNVCVCFGWKWFCIFFRIFFYAYIKLWCPHTQVVFEIQIRS